MIYENGMANMWTIADSQQNNQSHNHLPTGDAKNSYANVTSTSQLPGAGGGKGNQAGVFTPGENEEEIIVKGFGKMTRKQLKSLINKTAKAIHRLAENEQYDLLKTKNEMLTTLIKYCK